jgi:uncharacterized protein (DUF58 family)
MTRPTSLLGILSTFAGWTLFLGLLSGRMELFIVAIPLVVALLSVRKAPQSSDLSLTASPSSTRFVEGDRFELVVTIVAGAAAPVLEMLVSLPPTILLVSGSKRVVVSMEKSETFEWKLALCSMAPGKATLGIVNIRTLDHSGSSAAEMQLGVNSEVHIYPRIVRVRHLPKPGSTRTSFGNYVAPQAGSGLEPSEIRPQAPGDRIRQVNWPASLRLGQLYVTQYHQERNADVVLLLDALAESGARPNSTLNVSVRAAAALASAYIVRRDRVGFIEYGGYLRWTKPASGRRHIEGLLKAVLPADVVYTEVVRDLDLLPPSILPRQALIIALSPLIDERFSRTIVNLVSRGYEVLTLAISPIALTRRMLRPSKLHEVTYRVWALERRARLNELRGRGIRVVDWDPEQPLEVALTLPRPTSQLQGTVP